MNKGKGKSGPDLRNCSRPKAWSYDLHCKAVMVNFMCQLDWGMGCPDIWLNLISGCVCEVVSG